MGSPGPTTLVTSRKKQCKGLRKQISVCRGQTVGEFL